MARCPALTRSGDQCSASVRPGDTWCYNHDPARQDERRRNASKAGASRPNREVQDLKRQLADLYDATLEGTVDKGVAAVLAQIANARTRLLETERRIRETEELEERIRQMEEMIA